MPAADTPMMRQYNEIREQYPDCMLFFRLGDFYEMFDDDAVAAAEMLDLTLTTRDKGKDEGERTPMCGVPYHSAEGYIARLIARGVKVAICEQTEDPSLAKGIVKREVTRVITPGTVLESAMMDESENNYLAAVDYDGSAMGAAFVDITTGEYFVTEVAQNGQGNGEAILAAQGELGRFMPREVLLTPDAARDATLGAFIRDRLRASVSVEPESLQAEARVLAHFGMESIKAAGLADKPAARRAVAALLDYCQKLGIGGGPAPSLNVYNRSGYMELDMTAKRNMELTEAMGGAGEARKGNAKAGTLLWVLDCTGTSIGSRLLRAWVERPLTVPGEIMRRQRAVAELCGESVLRGELRGAMKNLPDMERLTARAAYGAAGPRDLRALAAAAGRVPYILSLLDQTADKLLRELLDSSDSLSDIQEKLSSAIIEDPPYHARDGGFIRPGFNAEADRLRDILTNSKSMLAAMEAEEREKTGIKSLKAGFNKVFGYYFEVSKSYYSQVPERFIRKQTLASCERYFTQELKELEGDILSAGERLTALESQLFSELRAYLTENSGRIKRTAVALAQADVLAALAETAVKYRYCAPEVDGGDEISIEEGRHPVVERMLKDDLFVPNGTRLSSREPSAIITGPNMAGKSTYMRQVALITLMAQIGSFVPAKRARIGVVDRIFTRVGASDDLAGGRSTFMVEMTEVADILRFATAKSLIILDEVGRGTSTFDGMSVARAVLEHIHRHIKAKTLFATHYHELTDLEQQLPGVVNYNVAVKKRGEEIVFLRRIMPGGADDSFGVEVARLAGLPSQVVNRARAILKSLENGEAPKMAKTRAETPQAEAAQISLAGLAGEELLRELKALDLDTLTPLEAMNRLYAMRKKAGEGA
ncbi:MAG: DNA mismatch repair protein MutS [Oscillospiraceae bacterium]|jgi:DNA mismatch repair protein MutS|nr:DNA mismatch repair protein MutS [Oscillospiraceae bacterium]